MLSRQEFIDQPVSQKISDGQRYTRAPLGARGNASCSMVQSCQVNWQITILGERLALQLNLISGLATPIITTATTRARVNFNGLANSQADYTRTMECGGAVEPTKQPLNENVHIKLWIGYTTACGSFQQIAICKDYSKLWETSIYAREQATIAANLLSQECTKNSVSVSPLETVVRGRRHCGIFLDIPVDDFTAEILIRNFASLYLQLRTYDFLQDLKVVLLNKIQCVQDGARTNIQVTLQGNLTNGIVDSTLIVDDRLDNQNNLVEFVAARAYSQPTNAKVTPQMHYFRDATIRFIFDDASDPQVLNFEIIVEISGTMVRSG
ncbi:MAG: hypothetical protein EZS28_009464 [Streblomastix strix]|uniref:Uncharacterized protein n=1 Tax=Streblomastix strix TaxID=222440 RepID=A0A5J4WK22_9EUKA|nr:MAG: hypothetical protein EZS28_009464 [Streblomastix strix]